MTTRASVTINTQADRDKVARWAMQTAEGTIVEFRKKTRSHEQNAKMHAMLGEVSAQVVWYGEKLEPEDWKTMFTASLRKANVIPGIDAGTVVPLGLSTSAMTVEEMSALIELMYAFGAERGVVFKEPQETPNTDDSGPPNQASSVAGEELPSSPQQDGGEVPSPSLASSPSELSSRDRHHLMDFARKAFSTAGDQRIPADKRAALQGEVSTDAYSKSATIQIAAKQVCEKPADIEARRRFIARDLLECSPTEIGG